MKEHVKTRLEITFWALIILGAIHDGVASWIHYIAAAVLVILEILEIHKMDRRKRKKRKK